MRRSYDQKITGLHYVSFIAFYLTNYLNLIVQRIAKPACQPKKAIMIRSLAALIVFVYVFAACKKDGAQSESALYGTWVKGSQAGDTLAIPAKERETYTAAK